MQVHRKAKTTSASRDALVQRALTSEGHYERDGSNTVVAYCPMEAR